MKFLAVLVVTLIFAGCVPDKSEKLIPEGLDQLASRLHVSPVPEKARVSVLSGSHKRYDAEEIIKAMLLSASPGTHKKLETK